MTGLAVLLWGGRLWSRKEAELYKQRLRGHSSRSLEDYSTRAMWAVETILIIFWQRM